MKFKGHELTREELMRAMECETPEELMELVKKIDIEITREEAEAYLETMEELELSPEETEDVAGGRLKGKSSCPNDSCGRKQIC